MVKFGLFTSIQCSSPAVPVTLMTRIYTPIRICNRMLEIIMFWEEYTPLRPEALDPLFSKDFVERRRRGHGYKALLALPGQRDRGRQCRIGFTAGLRIFFLGASSVPAALYQRMKRMNRAIHESKNGKGAGETHNAPRKGKNYGAFAEGSGPGLSTDRTRTIGLSRPVFELPKKAGREV